jgi:hypothetical protein
MYEETATAVGAPFERGVMPQPTIVERLRRRTLVCHGGESKYGWNLTEGDSELHMEAANEIEKLLALLGSANGNEGAR